MSARRQRFYLAKARRLRICCLHCKKPLGKKPAFVITMLARFGELTFGHHACFPDEKRRRA